MKLRRSRKFSRKAKRRQTVRSRSRRQMGGTLDEDVSSAQYNVHVILFTEREATDDIKTKLLNVLRSKYENVEITSDPDIHNYLSYSFKDVTSLPRNLHDKAMVVYKMNNFPEYLKITKDDYKSNVDSMDHIIDRKLTWYEGELGLLVKPIGLTLIPGTPGIHTPQWIPKDFPMPYEYAVGLILGG